MPSTVVSVASDAAVAVTASWNTLSVTTLSFENISKRNMKDASALRFENIACNICSISPPLSFLDEFVSTRLPGCDLQITSFVNDFGILRSGLAAALEEEGLKLSEVKVIQPILRSFISHLVKSLEIPYLRITDGNAKAHRLSAIFMIEEEKVSYGGYADGIVWNDSTSVESTWAESVHFLLEVKALLRFATYGIEGTKSQGYSYAEGVRQERVRDAAHRKHAEAMTYPLLCDGKHTLSPSCSC